MSNCWRCLGKWLSWWMPSCQIKTTFVPCPLVDSKTKIKKSSILIEIPHFWASLAMWLVEEQLEYALHKLGLNLESNEWVRGVECRLRGKGDWVGGRLVGGWKWTKYPAWGALQNLWYLILDIYDSCDLEVLLFILAVLNFWRNTSLPFSTSWAVPLLVPTEKPRWSWCHLRLMTQGDLTWWHKEGDCR